MKASNCTTSGARHSWLFVRNVNVGAMRITSRGSTGRFSLKGLYRCACGQSKYGQYDPNGSDLRGVIETFFESAS